MNTPPTPEPPTRANVDRAFVDLLAGRSTRDEADRWAAQWVAAADPNVDDDVVWWGLMHLFGIDLPQGPGQQYLYDDEQISEWLEEFKLRAGVEP